MTRAKRARRDVPDMRIAHRSDIGLSIGCAPRDGGCVVAVSLVNTEGRKNGRKDQFVKKAARGIVTERLFAYGGKRPPPLTTFFKTTKPMDEMWDAFCQVFFPAKTSFVDRFHAVGTVYPKYRSETAWKMTVDVWSQLV